MAKYRHLPLHNQSIADNCAGKNIVAKEFAAGAKMFPHAARIARSPGKFPSRVKIKAHPSSWASFL
jgi:hypothetical protein